MAPDAQVLLWKSKRITAITLLTLALCIGATRAISGFQLALLVHELQVVVLKG